MTNQTSADSKRPTTLEELRVHRDDIMRIAAGHGASNLRVFGSVARGTAETESDIDFSAYPSYDDMGKFLRRASIV